MAHAEFVQPCSVTQGQMQHQKPVFTSWESGAGASHTGRGAHGLGSGSWGCSCCAPTACAGSELSTETQPWCGGAWGGSSSRPRSSQCCAEHQSHARWE